ncbi:hypothetical protein BD311DRAFT_667492 [Dichomitus squalens]|uniref:Uncharacterized protein n=1 Tax=Dichomitus squalens TaxID=114155 RepID=A0A4Q9PJZ7_9APHY|nr:hypothetical protein BD311DRAFT_667492 [Dichomitus squalens]TBU54431.1 hypothetical protein BD310DRAFT_951470 [Dichomitus squalens]
MPSTMWSSDREPATPRGARRRTFMSGEVLRYLCIHTLGTSMAIALIFHPRLATDVY